MGSDFDVSGVDSGWDMFGTGGMGFGLITVLFFVVFFGILGVIIYNGVKHAAKAAENNAAPEVSAVATVVARRVETSGGGERIIHQRHFVTFEQPGGERFEMEIEPTDFGTLVEGDHGTVTMKGTRYLGFAREVMR
jgi:hypothetical protein